MIDLLKCEYLKTRKRYIFVTAVIITAIQLVWALYSKYGDFQIKNGWMLFLYQFPLVNAIFIPILTIIVSSRLCDIEHKGEMIKQLCVITDKGKLFDAKFLYGLFIVLFCNVLSWSVTIIFGCIKGFGGNVPVKLYLLYLLFTITPTISIYILQHTLSLLFKNQAVTFFVGIIGVFTGVFSMFLPQIPILRKIFIWGWYGVLQLVGMFGWTKQTRMENVYFEVMDIDWTFFCIMVIVSVVMYIVGRKMFCESEV